MEQPLLKNYTETLSKTQKEEYLAKLEQCEGVDPYSVKHSEYKNDVDKVPNFTRHAIMNFILHNVKAEVLEEMQSYKDVESYITKFACKWVRQIKYYQCNNVFIVVGQVGHSQRVNEPDLIPWVSVSHTGAIHTSHCNCVAGFGKQCSHVAAILFALEYSKTQCTVNPGQSVTDVLAYWTAPKRKGVFHKRVDDIDFRTPKRCLEEGSSGHTSTHNNFIQIPQVTEEEKKEFLYKCQRSGQDVALFQVVDEFQAKKKTSRQESLELDNCLTTLYRPECVSLTLPELRTLAESIWMTTSVTQETCDKINEITKGQSNNARWYLHKRGRITASTLKMACHTKVDKPSITLIKSICYPKETRKVPAAMRYGLNNEKKALDEYLEYHKMEHPNAVLQNCGLLINPRYPFFGASLDSILECNECERTCVEVKCPYGARDITIEEWMQAERCYLLDINGSWQLDVGHHYYYQCQMQMAIANCQFCDFVVWCQKEMFIQRLPFDLDFWEAKSKQAKHLIINVILPELLGKYYTRTVPSE